MSKIVLNFEPPELMESGGSISDFSGSVTFVGLSLFDNRFPDYEVSIFDLPLIMARKRTKKEKEHLKKSFLFKTK